MSTLNEVIERVGRESVAAIGIANQRETVVAWNREAASRTAPPSSGRTAAPPTDARRSAKVAISRWSARPPGLVLDPYFSASKFEWLLTERDIPIDDESGARHDRLVADLEPHRRARCTPPMPTNASRTMLFDIRTLQWSADLCDLFGVPDVGASRGAAVERPVRHDVRGMRVARAAFPISGVAGDQQAALFGQACFTPGMAKNTYGTGSFVLLNVGSSCPPPTEGMLTTVAWKLADGTVAYALEGAIFVTGAAVQWMRDGLGLIESASEIGPLAESVADNGGVYLVPAFAGLGSPWWDPYARGTVVGITRGTSKAHIARAVVEAMAYQTRDVVEAMAAASGTTLAALRVDGGAAVMDLLLQMQADQLGVTVQRPTDQETTALGAAYLAGLAEGVWPSMSAISDRWEIDATFHPATDRTMADLAHAGWLRAVDRSRAWVASA